MSYPTKANLTYKKLLTLLAIVIIALMVSTIYVAGQANNYQQQYQEAQIEIQQKNEEIDRLSAVNLQAINFGSSSDHSFSGTIFNAGRTDAHNVRVVIHSPDSVWKDWSATIWVGDIDAQDYKLFSQSVSSPSILMTSEIRWDNP